MSARVLGVSSAPFHKYGCHSISYPRLKPVVIATNVEYHDVVGEKASGRVPILNILRRPPIAGSHVVDPILDPVTAIRVPITERGQYFHPKYFHSSVP